MKTAVVGSIAGGKSTVMRIIGEYYGENAVCFSCDEINKELLSDKTYIKLIEKEFGTVKDGVIDKKALANLIFNDAAARNRLNSLAHPLIRRMLLSKIADSSKDRVFVEVPLLNESGFRDVFDKVIFVDVSRAVKIARLCARDGISAPYALKKIESQTEETPCEGDLVINNDGNYDELKEKVTALLERIDG